MVDITWTGPNELPVDADELRLEWTMPVSVPPHLRMVNAANASLPLWTWRRGPLLRLREWAMRRFLDVGEVRLASSTPSGHDTVFVPEEEYPVRESEAILEGRSLGEPIRLGENPTIGDVPLPTRPSLVIGQVYLRITDPDEYERSRERVRDDPCASDPV